MEKRTKEEVAREAIEDMEETETREILKRIERTEKIIRGEFDADIKAATREVIEEIEELIRSGVDENGEVAEGWLEDWSDVEYRISRQGTYRGVSLLQEEYMNNYDYEIETTKQIIIVVDSYTGRTLAIKRITDKETIKALKAINELWANEYYEDWGDTLHPVVPLLSPPLYRHYHLGNIATE